MKKEKQENKVIKNTPKRGILKTIMGKTMALILATLMIVATSSTLIYAIMYA